jgi:hypothetical protein
MAIPPASRAAEHGLPLSPEWRVQDAKCLTCTGVTSQFDFSIFGDDVPTTREKKSGPTSPRYITISSSFKQGCKRITNDPWVLEYLAATLAISAVAALITVLA